MKLKLAKTAVAPVLILTFIIIHASPSLADRIRQDQWHLNFLKVEEAHKITQGEGVTVAVIDSGVDPHPDLLRNLLPGTDIAQDGDGQSDSNGHGTAMAGLIAAHGGAPGTGALGIAPKSRILPVRDQHTNSAGTSTDIAKGISWATTNGADIISISSGTSPSPELRKAIADALESNIIIVASAGNDPTSGIAFPAIIDGVVAVGAVDSTGTQKNSAHGRKLALTAPGIDIYSTSKDGKYYRGTGTSGAAAIVSGAAALVRSKFPNLSAEEVVHRLTATAVDKGPPGRDEQYGYGVLDLVAALTADVPPLGASPDQSASPSPSPSRSSAAGDGPDDGPSEGLRPGFFVLGAVAAAGLAAVALFVSRRRRRGAG